LFQRLESSIYYYHEEKELQYAKYKADEFDLYCHPAIHYWGEAQFHLLPALDEARRSWRANELIAVLSRRFHSYHPFSFHYHGYSVGFSGVKSVVSPISDRIERLSDEAWVQLMTDSRIPLVDRHGFREREGAYIESSVSHFASSLLEAAKQNPGRFLKLVLCSADPINIGYIASVLGGADTVDENSSEWQVICEDVQRLILRYIESSDRSFIYQLCKVIEHHPADKWGDAIFDYLAAIGSTHPDPEEGKPNVTSSDDPKGKRFDSIYSNTINCVRGYAAEAIGSILWKAPKLYERFLDTTTALMENRNIVVKMASMFCICPIYSIDKKTCTEFFFKVCRSNVLLTAHPLSHQMFWLIYNDGYQKEVEALLTMMTNSEEPEINKLAAYHITQFSMRLGVFNDLLGACLTGTEEQRDGIIDVVFQILGDDVNASKYRSDCLKLTSELINSPEVNIKHRLGLLFLHDYLNPEVDQSFILAFAKSPALTVNAHYFFEFIKGITGSLLPYRAIILEACRNSCELYQADNSRFYTYELASDLSFLLVNLFDQADTEELRSACLEIWDLMFLKQVGTMRELTKAINDI
jgi:hypothetical protein